MNAKIAQERLAKGRRTTKLPVRLNVPTRKSAGSTK